MRTASSSSDITEAAILNPDVYLREKSKLSNRKMIYTENNKLYKMSLNRLPLLLDIERPKWGP
jgi:hypothetical protein